MEKLSCKVDRFCASGRMLKQKQTIALLLHHGLGFIQRVGMFEFCG
jgi:hypothetical protein